jgi:hypothetical protein
VSQAIVASWSQVRGSSASYGAGPTALGTTVMNGAAYDSVLVLCKIWSIRINMAGQQIRDK